MFWERMLVLNVTLCICTPKAISALLGRRDQVRHSTRMKVHNKVWVPALKGCVLEAWDA